MFTHTHTCTHTRAHTHAHTCTHAHAHMHTRTHVHTRAHTRAHTCTRAHAHTRARTCTHMHTHMRTHTQGCRHTWPPGVQVSWQGASEMLHVGRVEWPTLISSHLILFCVRTQIFQILTQSLCMRNHCIPNLKTERVPFRCPPTTCPTLCQAHSMQHLASPLTHTCGNTGPSARSRGAES